VFTIFKHLSSISKENNKKVIAGMPLSKRHSGDIRFFLSNCTYEEELYRLSCDLILPFVGMGHFAFVAGVNLQMNEYYQADCATVDNPHG
jgi:hypothetical protein